MGTSGGEPRVLLNALKPMLGVVGDIRTPQEVMRVVGMMKDAEKLMSRCVYLNILKSTCRQALKNEEKKDTLQKFLATGGWGILNKWLHEFTRAENFPVLIELIDVLKVMPVTVELLKQGNTGKVIKQMTKLENADVKKGAACLIKQWKEMIRGGPDKKSDENDGKNDVETPPAKRSSKEENKGPPEKKSKTKDGPKIADSTGFMNALNAAAPVGIKKRRRNSNTKTALPLDEILNKETEKKPKLEADNPNLTNQPTSPTESMDPSAPSQLVYISPAVEAANAAFASLASAEPVKDENSLARRKNKTKRNITWPPDDQLVKVKYYELQEGERKIRHVENFSQALHHELMLEKQAMRMARLGGEDKMTERVKYGRLIPVDNAGVPNFMPGEKSREKYIQAEREKSVLAFIFLTKDSLPDTPGEPDFDAEEHNNTRIQPKIIPHDEDGAVFPGPRVIRSQQESKSPEHRSSTETKPSTLNPSTAISTTMSASGLSSTVKNIMSQLMNVNGIPQTTEAQQSMTDAVTNLTNTMLGNDNNNMQAPPHPGPRPLFNAPPPTDLMQYPIEAPPPGMNGFPPRFRGGPPMRGGFHPRNGPPRPRWDGPPPGSFNNHPDNFRNENFHNGPPNGDYDNGFPRRGRGGFRGGPRGRGRPNDRDWNGPRRNNDYDGPRDRRNDRNRNERDDERGPPRRNRDKVCQHFNTAKGCRQGDRCTFVHAQR